jgi:hypothetical protein
MTAPVAWWCPNCDHTVHAGDCAGAPVADQPGPEPPCSTCGGTGQDFTQGFGFDCPDCIPVGVPVGDDTPALPCPTCSGSGESDESPPLLPCSDCMGSGETPVGVPVGDDTPAPTTPTYIHDGCGGVHPPGTPCEERNIVDPPRGDDPPTPTGQWLAKMALQYPPDLNDALHGHQGPRAEHDALHEWIARLLNPPGDDTPAPTAGQWTVAEVRDVAPPLFDGKAVVAGDVLTVAQERALVALVRRAGATPDLTALLDALDSYDAVGCAPERRADLIAEVRRVAALVRSAQTDTDQTGEML